MPQLSGRQWLLVCVGLVLLATTAFGLYGIVRGPAEPEHSHPRSSPVRVTPSRSTAPPITALAERTLPHTADPIAYARTVALALFTWDTTTGLLPSDYSSAVLADADPSGEETAGLIGDVASYLPAIDQWAILAPLQVSQSLTITSASVPALWSTALEQANGNIRPGTTAVTITGTRHRAGTWEDKPATASYRVAFTVFVACPPAFDRCHVLRLSRLDAPLR